MGVFRTIFGVGRVKEKFVRPHFYSFTINTFAANATCISPNRQRLPVRMFLVQADLGNGGIVNVGDTNVTLINGIQLDPGRAMQFSVNNEDITGNLFETPMDWQSAVARARQTPQPEQENLYMDLADFYVAGDVDNQRVRVFWTTITT